MPLEESQEALLLDDPFPCVDYAEPPPAVLLVLRVGCLEQNLDPVQRGNRCFGLELVADNIPHIQRYHQRVHCAEYCPSCGFRAGTVFASPHSKAC